jgi:hypothetical protein
MKHVLLLIILFISITYLSAQGSFTKIIDSQNPIANFKFRGVYLGTAWVDLNNDGLLDLFAMPNFIFINLGAGKFIQKNDTIINAKAAQIPGGCSFADLNNDGFIDLVCSQYPSTVYLNNGDATFKDVSKLFPDLNTTASWGAAIGNANNDNKLDIIFVQAKGFHAQARPMGGRFFLQNKSGFSFTEQKGYAFTDSLQPFTVPYWIDYDLDGDMDLFIATGPGGSRGGSDYCYKNLSIETGSFKLSRMTEEPWAKELQDGQNYNFIDYDNDGDLDLFLTNYGGGGAAPSRFYENDKGIYQSKKFAFTTIMPLLSNCWADFDNDGFIDLITTSDNQSVKYYKNKGDKSFTELANGIALDYPNPPGNNPAQSGSITAGDYDNDGDLDVFVYGNNPAHALFNNNSFAGNNKSIQILFVGVESNKSALGTTIKLKSKINNKSIWQIRQVTAQNTFLGQNDLKVHFGLADANIIDELIIYWPSGLTEKYINKKLIKNIETIIEGNGIKVK